jgi:hypothetical protein
VPSTLTKAPREGSADGSREVDMAEAEITHRWPEGGSVRFVLRSEADHPDAMDMLATRVLRLYREGVPAEDVDE